MLGSLRCDCGRQLDSALEQIAKAPAGLLLYLRQEGRGIGLANKLKAYALQDKGLNTITANEALGFDADLRNYGIALQMLQDLNIKQIHLLTNNPDKIKAFDEHDINIMSRIPLETKPHEDNYHYLTTKKTKMGHNLSINLTGDSTCITSKQ